MIDYGSDVECNVQSNFFLKFANCCIQNNICLYNDWKYSSEKPIDQNYTALVCGGSPGFCIQIRVEVLSK